MTLKQSLAEFWEGFFDFEDSSPKSEFMPNALLYLVIIIVSSMILPALGALATGVVIVPFVALCVRRCHDTGCSALLLLWIILPIFGVFIDLAILTAKTQTKDNPYDSPDPWYEDNLLNEAKSKNSRE